MSYNGSGTFNINTTGQPVVAGTIISAATFNALTADLATGLTTALTKDGQTTTTARIPFAQGINSTLATDASSVSTGSIITAGGVGIAKKLYVGTDVNVAGNAAITGTLGVTGVATFIAPILGTPSSGNLTSCTADGTNKVGYINIPLSGIKTASYTLVAGDVGKFVELGTSGTVVVPASVFAAGDAISIFNNTSASISCTCSAVTTVYKGGTDADIASFSVTTRGVATILFITATVAVVTGNLA
jgi:hypothetical protein